MGLNLSPRHGLALACWGFAGLLSASGAFPAAAADLRQVGPQASAAQIIAVRGSAEQPTLRLTFAVSGGGRATPEILAADLAPDYVLIRNGTQASVYDYKLRRMIGLEETTHIFRNDSLYGFTDFRVAETYNRHMLREMLARAGAPAAMDDDFWVQSELHAVKTAETVPGLERQSIEGGARFIYKGAEAASYALSGQILSAGEGGALRHLLFERAGLHPSIIAALIETGRVPQKLTFSSPPSRKKNPETWTLQSAARLNAPYPLTAAYAAAPLAQRKELTALANILPVMLKAGAVQPGSDMHSVAQYYAAVDEALEQHAGLRAALLAFEATEQYGQQTFDCSATQAQRCHSLKEIFTEAQKNSRANDLLRALALERTDRQEAIAVIRAIQHDDVGNGYVIDDFAGNMMGSAGKQADAVPLVIKAVRGDPYVAGYYKDLGDLFRRSFEPVLAWTCYDLGRVLPGGADAPVIETIGAYEKQLAADYPQFF